MPHAIPKRLIQVAGVLDLQEAHLLMQHRVDWLGFPLRLDVHEEDLSDDDAAVIVGAIHKPHRAVLITYLSTSDDIAALARQIGAKAVQIHGAIMPPELEKLRRDHPDLLIVKSIVIREEDSFETHEATLDVFGAYVDAFITDTFDAATGASGATGKVHDWSLSRMLVDNSPRPVILAGGLNPDNVGAAIRAVRPAGVDVHTGVEDSNGRKSEERVIAFVNEARAAFASL